MRSVQRVAELAFTKVEDRILVVVAKTREVHLLNPSAARIWELLESPSTVERLIETLNEEYEFDPSTGKAEVDAAVSEMIEKGLVKAV